VPLLDTTGGGTAIAESSTAVEEAPPPPSPSAATAPPTVVLRRGEQRRYLTADAIQELKKKHEDVKEVCVRKRYSWNIGAKSKSAGDGGSHGIGNAMQFIRSLSAATGTLANCERSESFASSSGVSSSSSQLCMHSSDDSPPPATAGAAQLSPLASAASEAPPLPTPLGGAVLPRKRYAKAQQQLKRDPAIESDDVDTSDADMGTMGRHVLIRTVVPTIETQEATPQGTPKSPRRREASPVMQVQKMDMFEFDGEDDASVTGVMTSKEEMIQMLIKSGNLEAS